MNRAKIFITFTFLLAFAVGVSAQEQTPKIVWKNLQEKYDRFEDIKPVIQNASSQNIYIDSYYAHSARLVKYFEQYDQWIENPIMVCGTLNKKELREIEKRKFAILPNAENFLEFSEENWNTFIFGDGFLYPGFKSKQSDNANGRYKFLIYYEFDTQNKKRQYSESYSPEFQVVEKN